MEKVPLIVTTPEDFETFVKEYKNNHSLDWRELMYSLFKQIYSENSHPNIDDIIDTLLGRALKKWREGQENFAKEVYQYSLANMTKTENIKMQKAIEKFFHNDMLMDTNLESVEKWESNFEKLREQDVNFWSEFHWFLYEKLSLQDFAIAETLSKWCRTYRKHICIWLNCIKKNKEDYRFNHRTRVETLTALILAKNRIPMDQEKLTSAYKIYCLPGQEHKNINHRKVLFFCVQTNLSMKATWGGRGENK